MSSIMIYDSVVHGTLG